MMDKGYEQSVQNLALKIIEFTTRDLDPVADVLDTFTTMVQYIDSNPEMAHDWDQLEDIADTICKTYNVEHDDLFKDVFTTMIKYDMQDPKYWN